MNKRTASTSLSELGRLEDTIGKIGMARFVGRINSGLVDAELGYKAVDAYCLREQRRPLLSKISHILLGVDDPYSTK